MTGASDTSVVSVHVAVPPSEAFTAFTVEVDAWWRRGPKYRHADRQGQADAAEIVIEPGVGGRIFERWEASGAEQFFELGRVTDWRPPHGFAFTWRNATFAGDETTFVEVSFAPAASGTLVTVRHKGWADLRPDHPARHGQDDRAVLRSAGMWWGGLLMALRERTRRA